jgi:hypothetical protein
MSTIAPPKPPRPPTLSDRVRSDPKAVALIKSVRKVGTKKYVDNLTGDRVLLLQSMRDLGYDISASNLFVLVNRIRGTWVGPSLEKSRAYKAAARLRKLRRIDPNAQEKVKASKIQSEVENAATEPPDSLTVELEEPEPPGTRYSVVRNTSRRGGGQDYCSWGIMDDWEFQNAVCFIGSNLKEALLKCAEWNRPAEKIKYTRHGMTGFVVDEEPED